MILGRLRPARERPAIVIVGAVRNGAGQLERTVRRLRKAFSGCELLGWFLVESDSEDGTLQTLERLAKSNRGFGFRSLGRLAETIPLRTARLARCRNECLREMRDRPAFQAATHIVVADFDGVNDLLSRQAVQSCWRRSDWDAVSANQRGPYYDVWALRHAEWSPDDCWARLRALVRLGLTEEEAKWAAVFSRMRQIETAADWIEVDSAFGGLAIYRKDAFVLGTYDGLDATGAETCEHVAFHRALREQGKRMFINPALINTSQTEHTPFSAPASRANGWRRLTAPARKFARRFVRP